MSFDTPISVIMSVYNGEGHIHSALESILNQSFSDFELIIIDDGSTDKTPEILARYAQRDSRIRIISQKNTGLTIALNNGLKEARGVYIARQDADDFALPQRLKAQFTLMEEHKDIVLCGANCINVYADGLRTHWGWEDEMTLAKTLYYKTPFAHSTAFIRKSALDTAAGYDERYKTSQDTELWMRLAKYGRITMIKDPLVERHIIASSISIKRRWRQFYDALRSRLHCAPKKKKLAVVIYSLRSLCIGLLPDYIIQHFKKDLRL